MVVSIKKVSIIGLGALGIMYGQHFSQKLPKENVRIIADKNVLKNIKLKGYFATENDVNSTL